MCVLRFFFCYYYCCCTKKRKKFFFRGFSTIYWWSVNWKMPVAIVILYNIWIVTHTTYVCIIKMKATGYSFYELIEWIWIEREWRKWKREREEKERIVKTVKSYQYVSACQMNASIHIPLNKLWQMGVELDRSFIFFFFYFRFLYSKNLLFVWQDFQFQRFLNWNCCFLHFYFSL